MRTTSLTPGAEIPLWRDGAPGSEGMTAPEAAEPPNAEHDYLKVWSIHRPYGGPFGETLSITPETPPAFLLGACDDRLVGERLPQLYLALRQAGVPTEMHVYVDGGHGFGIRKPPAPVPSASTWQHRLGDWLADRGLVPLSAVAERGRG